MPRGRPHAREGTRRRAALLALISWLVLAVAGCPRRSAPPAAPPAARLEVWFLDVGQGDSAVIRTPGGKVLLVDGGRGSAGPTVLAFLRSHAIQALDWVIASHPHDDHIGGLIDVLEAVPARQVLDSGFVTPSPVLKRYLTLIRQRGIPFQRARPGQKLEIEPGVALEFLAPPPPFLKDTASDANNNSVVFRLTDGGVRFLFTGDMQEAERRWVIRSPQAAWLPAEVLKVAHHGSHNGTDREFLQRVRPRYAIISSGGEYGHPHAEALDALRLERVSVYRTDRMGTIHVTTDGSRIEIRGAGAPAGAPVRGSGSGSAPAAPAAAAPVIGNRRSRIYHRPTCSALPERENQVRFPNEQEAIRKGYQPHAACIR